MALQSAIDSMNDFAVEVNDTLTPISRCFATQKECILDIFIKTFKPLPFQDQTKDLVNVQRFDKYRFRIKAI